MSTHSRPAVRGGGRASNLASWGYNGTQGGFIVSVLDFIFPKRCLGCGRIGKYFCDSCRKGIRPVQANEAVCPVCERAALDGRTHPGCNNRYAPDGLTSVFHYEGIIRKAIAALKYRFVSDLAHEFVSLIPPSFVSNPLFTQSVVVPIPLHRSRRMERGFNQAEVLAGKISARLHRPMRTDMLRRVRKTPPQVAMQTREYRLANMKDVFAMNPSAGLMPEVIILVDDVFTTGATMRSATNVLKRGGVKHVWAVTMAR